MTPTERYLAVYEHSVAVQSAVSERLQLLTLLVLAVVVVLFVVAILLAISILKRGFNQSIMMAALTRVEVQVMGYDGRLNIIQGYIESARAHAKDAAFAGRMVGDTLPKVEQHVLTGIEAVPKQVIDRIKEVEKVNYAADTVVAGGRP